jgi:hypothetical protein
MPQAHRFVAIPALCAAVLLTLPAETHAHNSDVSQFTGWLH